MSETVELTGQNIIEYWGGGYGNPNADTEALDFVMHTCSPTCDACSALATAILLIWCCTGQIVECGCHGQPVPAFVCNAHNTEELLEKAVQNRYRNDDGQTKPPSEEFYIPF